MEQRDDRGSVTCIAQVSGVLDGLSWHITRDPCIIFNHNLLTPISKIIGEWLCSGKLCCRQCWCIESGPSEVCRPVI